LQPSWHRRRFHISYNAVLPPEADFAMEE